MVDPLKDTVRDLINEFCLSAEYFGETVTYTPVGGASRQIDVAIGNEEDIDFDGNDTETRREFIRVTCQRHPSDGIHRPNIGDQIVRDPVFEENTRPFVFMGEIDEESRDHWRLTFERKRRDAQGMR